MLMSVVVVGGAVSVLQFAEAADTSRWLTAPLLLLGAVAVPSIGAELAVARREEIGLARLRGIHGLRLWRFLLVEPFLAIALGTLVGLGVGAVGTVVATSTWLADAAPALARPALAAAAAIAGTALLLVGLCAAAALREPLAVQVSTRRRPRRATTPALFLSVLVFVAAAVAAYRSRSGDGATDVVVLLGPALVGLALGQASIWMVRIAARGLTPATERRGLGAFLAARRLARADDLVTPIRLVVAAAVVGALALSGAVSVSRWTGDQAAVEVPGARTIDVTALGAVGAVDLTEQVDPAGEHLIATAIVRNEARLAERRAYVDADRWDAVVGGFYDGTAARAASDAVGRLRTDLRPIQVVGDRLRISATATVLPPPQVLVAPDGTRLEAPVATGLEVRVAYVGMDNESGISTAIVRFESEGTPAASSSPIRGCSSGCIVTGLEVSRDLTGVYSTDPFQVLVGSLTVGDHDLTRDTWLPDPLSVEAALGDRFLPEARIDPTLVVNRPDALEVSLLPSSGLRLTPEDRTAPVPVLVADQDEPVALDLGGDDRASDVVGLATTLPLLGSSGVLADIRTSSVGSDPTVPAAEVQIVAAAGTPVEMLEQVAEATGSSWRAIATVRESLDERYGGAQSVAYGLTALACALIALLALGAGGARHLRDYRRDVASLRVLGVSLGTARRAGRAELVGLTVLVLGIVVAGGWLAVMLLLDALPLLALPVAGMPLDTSPHPWPLVIPAALAAAAVLLVGGRARVVRAATTRPSSLREEEGR